VSAKKIAHFPNFHAILCGAVATERQDVCQFFLLYHMQIRGGRFLDFLDFQPAATGG
jgi:hypothetical protein